MLNPSVRDKRVSRCPAVLVYLCILTVTWPNAVRAQQVLGPNPVIGGLQVGCGGIQTVVQPIPDIAMARPGVIFLSPMLFSLPPVLQVFIYAHECGHQVVGLNETAADCWAIRTGRDQGGFRQSDMAYIERYFSRNPGDWSHAPGPQRVAQLMACYGGSTSSMRSNTDSSERPDVDASRPSTRHGTLASGQTARITLTLRRRHDYTISGECDAECNDLDLVLRLNGTEVDSDESEDSVPVVSVSPDSTASYILEVKMADCSSVSCRYVIEVEEN